MPFAAEDRVRVTDQSNQFRNHLGKVTRVIDDTPDIVYVRVDGHEAAGEVYFTEKQLMISTLPSPVEYGDPE